MLIQIRLKKVQQRFGTSDPTAIRSPLGLHLDKPEFGANLDDRVAIGHFQYSDIEPTRLKRPFLKNFTDIVAHCQIRSSSSYQSWRLTHFNLLKTPFPVLERA